MTTPLGSYPKTGLALSIQQPWAWLIVSGIKQVENRDWATKVRGWIGIHAGKKLDSEGYAWIQAEFPHIALPAPEALERGGVVGRACLVDCVTARYGDPLFFGPFGFVLEDAESLPFMPCRGQLGFFRPEVSRGG